MRFKIERALRTSMTCAIVVASCCANPVVAYTHKPQKVVTKETKIQPVVTKNVKIQPENTLMHLVNKKQNVKKVTAIEVAQKLEKEREEKKNKVGFIFTDTHIYWVNMKRLCY